MKLRNRYRKLLGAPPNGYKVIPIRGVAPHGDLSWEDVIQGWRLVRTGDPDEILGEYYRDLPTKTALQESYQEACRVAQVESENQTSPFDLLNMFGAEEEVEDPTLISYDSTHMVRGLDGDAYVSRKYAYQIYLHYRRRAGLLVSPSDTVAKEMKRRLHRGDAKAIGKTEPYWFDVAGVCMYAASRKREEREEAVGVVLGVNLSELSSKLRPATLERMNTLAVPRSLFEKLTRYVDYLRASIPLEETSVNEKLVRNLRELNTHAHYLLGTSYGDEYEEDLQADFFELAGEA